MRKITLFLSFLLLTISFSNAQSVGRLWGMVSSGGDSAGGVLFNYNTQTMYDSIVRSFPTSPTGPQLSKLIQATDGNFYGMTFTGGTANQGTIFKCTPAGDVTLLYSFGSATNDGLHPQGSLLQAADGYLYGMTNFGGVWGGGIIFKCSTTGTYTIVYNFGSIANDGQAPYGSLIQATDGELYGMTSGGGLSGNGTIFKCTTSGAETPFYSFAGGPGDGAFPNGSLIQASDGYLYGMTVSGGSAGSGTIFTCDSLGANYSVLYNFTGTSADGGNPYGSLIQATDGNLYGMTFFGGANSDGTIFKCTTLGAVTLLWSFGNGNDGYYPDGDLVQATDGNLYGITSQGGSGNGIIFKCTITGNETPLHTFAGGAYDGSNSMGSLIQATDGNLYGMTNQGGESGNGIIFKCTTAGAETVLYPFGKTAMGNNPNGTLVQANDGYLYGVASGGGAYGVGTIFRCSRTGVITTLYSFKGGTDGAGPVGTLVANNGELYGMTAGGGQVGVGTIFKFNISSGLETVLHSFYGSYFDGVNPSGSLILANDNYLYGMTAFGGLYTRGIILKCDTGGGYRVLYNFSGAPSDGGTPLGSLVQASDGNLYGAMGGGASNIGAIIKCTTSGNETLVYSFAGPPNDGSAPFGNLIQGADSNLYGTTQNDGTLGNGILFSCTTGGTEKVLYNFAGNPDGAFPRSSLLQATDSNFYGMTVSGGTWGYGTVFKFTKADSNESVLVNFTDSANGGLPEYNNLLEYMSDSIAAVETCANTTLTALVTGGGLGTYSYLWSNSATTTAITVTTAGTYSVTVTNAKGLKVTTNITLSAGAGSNKSDTTAFACDSYRWRGHTYTVSGIPTDTLTNIHGCDSVVNLHLTIQHSNTGDTTAIVCGNYKWYGTNYVASGAPTHTLINSGGCDSVVTLHLTVNTPPTVSFNVTPDTTCRNGRSITLTGTPTGGSFSGTGVTGNQFDPPAVTSTGYYLITYSYTNGQGCTTRSTDSIYVDACLTGIADITNPSGMAVYPNPTNGLVTITNTNPSEEPIQITNELGQVIYQGNFSFKQPLVINLGGYAPGVYILRIGSGEATSFSKIIKL